jgi:UDP-N-acetylmuramate dehydrogenase
MDEISAFTDASQIQVQCGFPLQKLIKLSIEQGFSGMEGLVGIPGSLGGAIAGNAGSFGYEIKDAVASVSLLMTNGSIKTFPKYELSFGHRHFNIPNNAVITGAVLALRRDEPAVVQKRIKEFMLEKKARQPVAKFSAGCVFKNPSGVPAGRLIDEAGCKGMRCGGIEVSSLHANYFINSGSGTASDFLRLMEIVAEKVHALFGIMLEPEIKVIGRKG